MDHIITNRTSNFPKNEFCGSKSLNKKEELLFQFSDLSSVRNPLRTEYLSELEKLNSRFISKIENLPENNLVLIDN